MSSYPTGSPPALPLPATGTGPPVRRGLRALWQASPLGCLFAVYVAACVAWILIPYPGKDPTWTNVIGLPSAAVAVLATAGGFFDRRLDVRTRRAWRWIAIGYAANFVGDVAWWWVENVEGVDPTYGWANVGYYVFYPCLVTGLLLFATGLRDTRARWRLCLDLSTVVVGGGLVVWYFVASRVILSPAAPGEFWITLAYPVLDVLCLVGVAKVLLRRPPGAMRGALDLFALGLVVNLAANTLWASESNSGAYRTGGLADVLWQVYYFLAVLGADLAIRRLQRDVAPAAPVASIEGYSWLPYVAVAVGYGVLIVGVASAPTIGLATTGAAAGSVLLTALVIGRQFLASRDFAALRAERAARSSEERFRALVQCASDAILVLGADERVVYASPAASRIFRVPAERMLARTIPEFVTLSEPKDYRAIIDEARGRPASHTPPRAWSFVCAEGAQVRLESTAADLTADEHVGGIVVNTRDVSDRHALEVQLMHQAFHDGLTGLPNRALFRDRVDHALARAWRSTHRVAVLFVDLDHFKTVNDSIGHDQGDRLLVSAAQRLGRCLRAGDTAARLGGDEFGVLLEGIQDVEQIHAVCDRITAALRSPFALTEREATISGSIGVALAVDGDDADVLLRNADVAMYHAKESGRGRYRVFESSMHAVALARLDLREALGHAIDRDELTVCYQPLVDLVTREIRGVEALCRWTRRGGESVSPTVFIPIAEATGQIVPVGRYVLERACRDARAWIERMPPGRPFSVTVNLSVRQLQDEALVDDVRRVLAESRLSPSSLVLELTESVLAQDADAILAALTSLKCLGVRLAIDDFGTGYSSLAYLRRFPIDILKVAKSFVDDIRDDGEGEALAKTILSMAANLSLDTVAEGIETSVQADKLQSLGCRLGQGYLFAPALPADELARRLELPDPVPAPAMRVERS